MKSPKFVWFCIILTITTWAYAQDLYIGMTKNDFLISLPNAEELIDQASQEPLKDENGISIFAAPPSEQHTEYFGFRDNSLHFVNRIIRNVDYDETTDGLLLQNGLPTQLVALNQTGSYAMIWQVPQSDSLHIGRLFKNSDGNFDLISQTIHRSESGWFLQQLSRFSDENQLSLNEIAAALSERFANLNSTKMEKANTIANRTNTLPSNLGIREQQSPNTELSHRDTVPEKNIILTIVCSVVILLFILACVYYMKK